jgi:hypothetical protein
MLTSFTANLAVVLSSLWNYVRTSLSLARSLSLSLFGSGFLPCNAVSQRSSAERPPASFDLLTACIRNHIRYSITTKVVITAGPALLLWESGSCLWACARARVCLRERETETRLIIIKVVWLGEFISLSLVPILRTHTYIQRQQRLVDLMILHESLPGSKSMNLNLLKWHLLSVLVGFMTFESAYAKCTGVETYFMFLRNEILAAQLT